MAAVLIVLFWALSIVLLLGAQALVRALGGGWVWLDLAQLLAVSISGALLGRFHPGVRDVDEAVGIGVVWLVLSIVAEIVGTAIRGGAPWTALLEDHTHGGFWWSIALMAAWLLAPMIAMRRRT